MNNRMHGGGLIAMALCFGITGAAAQEHHEASADTHVVEKEVVVPTGPGEVTEAGVRIEEPLASRDELPTQSPGEPAPESPPLGALEGTTLTDAEAAELVGQPLRAREGTPAGEITAVVRSHDGLMLHAVVELAAEEQTVSLPLDRISIDAIGRVSTEMSGDELAQLESHDPAQYASIDEDDGDAANRSLR
jgi:hypothetical protein